MAKLNPLHDEAFGSDYDQVEALKDALCELMLDVEYLLLRTHRHLAEASKLQEIQARLTELQKEPEGVEDEGEEA